MLPLALALAMAPAHLRHEVPRRYQRTQLAGMSILTGYALGNIGWGISSALRTRGVTQHVHEMNAAWNGVNLTLGVIGLIRNRRPPTLGGPNDAAVLYRRTRGLFALNSGLDVLYLAAGSIMWRASEEAGSERDRLEGYGRSIALQGAFLFAFDLAMLLAHERAFAMSPIVGRRLHGVALSRRF